MKIDKPYPKISQKLYACRCCGHVEFQSTNHYGPTWSNGRTNVCRECPPNEKYPEFGGITYWDCLDRSPRKRKTNQ